MTSWKYRQQCLAFSFVYCYCKFTSRQGPICYFKFNNYLILNYSLCFASVCLQFPMEQATCGTDRTITWILFQPFLFSLSFSGVAFNMRPRYIQPQISSILRVESRLLNVFGRFICVQISRLFGAIQVCISLCFCHTSKVGPLWLNLLHSKRCFTRRFQHCNRKIIPRAGLFFISHPRHK